MTELTPEMAARAAKICFGFSSEDVDRLTETIRQLQQLDPSQVLIRSDDLTKEFIGRHIHIIGRDVMGILNDVSAAEARHIEFIIVIDGKIQRLSYGDVVLLSMVD